MIATITPAGMAAHLKQLPAALAAARLGAAGHIQHAQIYVGGVVGGAQVERGRNGLPQLRLLGPVKGKQLCMGTSQDSALLLQTEE
jgi:hypothetical protein